jgi:hypothetical protein
MKKSRFTDSQIMEALKRVDAGLVVPENLFGRWQRHYDRFYRGTPPNGYYAWLISKPLHLYLVIWWVNYWRTFRWKISLNRHLSSQEHYPIPPFSVGDKVLLMGTKDYPPDLKASASLD